MIINDWDCRAPLGITLRRKGKSVTFGICGGTYVLVQRELDKSTSILRDCLAFDKEVFLGITRL